MKTKNILLGIFLLITLFTEACSRGPNTKAQINFSLGYEIAIASNKARVFGVMTGKATPERSYDITPGTTAEYIFPNGTYIFYTVEWNGSTPYTGALRCGTSSQVLLNGGSVAVNIYTGKNTSGRDYCGLSFFKTLFDNYCYEPEASDNGLFRAGIGTINNPYLICSIDQLNRISDNFSNSYIPTANYKLVRDLNFYAKFSNIPEALPFHPIGSTVTYYIPSYYSPYESPPFSGIFDGNGKSLYGMTIDVDFPSSQLGFIRNLSGTIKNINFYVPEIDSRQDWNTEQYKVGTVAGQTTGPAILNNVHVYYGRTRGTYQVGGLVGYASDFSGSVQIINSSYRKGEVSGRLSVGGLIGEIQNAYGNDIFRSFSSGVTENEGDNVSTSGNFGGLVGIISSSSSSATAHIKQSFSNMNVRGTNNAGGLVGIISSDLTLIEDSYSTGNIFAFGSLYSQSISVGGIVGDNSSNATLQRVFHTEGGVGAATGTTSSIGGIIGVGSTNVCLNSFATENPNQPIHCSGAGSYALDYNQIRSSSYFVGWDINGSTSPWIMDDDGYDYPRLNWEPPRICHGLMGSSFAGGSGTSASPYLICTTSQFNSIASNPSASFKLLRNIDLISYNKLNSYFNINFTGSLDGNYNSINNLNINTENSDVGLFNHISGSVQNLSLENLNINAGPGSTQGVGGVAANNSGLINNVQVRTGNISGDQNIGAIVGINEGTVALCSGEVPIKGRENTGGLVGYNLQGTIFQSRSYGPISLQSSPILNIGGLVGLNSNSLIAQSYSHSYIDIPSSEASSIGGFVGQNTTGSIIRDSYAAGSISSYSFSPQTNVGGFVGNDLGTINRSYASTEFNISNPQPAPDANWGAFAGASRNTNYSDSFVISSYDYSSWPNSNVTAATLIPGLGAGYSGDINLYLNKGWTIIANDMLAEEDPATIWVLKIDDSNPQLIHANYNNEGRDLNFYKNLLGF